MELWKYQYLISWHDSSVPFKIISFPTLPHKKELWRLIHDVKQLRNKVYQNQWTVYEIWLCMSLWKGVEGVFILLLSSLLGVSWLPRPARVCVSWVQWPRPLSPPLTKNSTLPAVQGMAPSHSISSILTSTVPLLCSSVLFHFYPLRITSNPKHHELPTLSPNLAIIYTFILTETQSDQDHACRFRLSFQFYKSRSVFL